MIGIISYLPPNDKLRNIRKKNIQLQKDWLKEVFPNEHPLVIAQGYTDEDLANDGYYEYEVYKDGIGSHKSRNLILRKFYSSEDEWLLLLDDDVIVYDYYDINSFLHNLYYGEYNNLDIQILVPLMPEQTPFKEFNLKNDTSHYFNFEPSPVNNCPNMMFLRNGVGALYFDDTINLLDKSAIPDDIKFIVDAVASGIKVHRATFWIKKSLDIMKSVIYSTNEKENKVQHRNLVSNLKHYVITSYNVKSLRDFNTKYNKATHFRIRRKTVYDLPDNLRTVKSRKRKSRLF